MNFIRLLALCVVSFLFVLPSEEADSRAKSYPLMCRGGSAMNGSISHSRIYVRFLGAKQGVSVRPPQPGECAWLDRGFLPGEPQVFIWYPSDTIGLSIDFGNNEVNKISAGNAKFNYVANGILKGTTFQVHAYRGQCPGPKCDGLWVTGVR